jgi:protein kinase-like protein
MQTGAFLTATGTTVGTPTYMAPEQAMAQDIGPPTDLYSVGCMAFEMFTGRVPFHDTEAPMAILLRHVNEQIPSVKSVDPKVDQDISDWIDRLLVKDPKQRTQNANDAWDEFEEIIIGLLGPRWRREARLREGSAQFDTPAPLTPAPFQGTTSDAAVSDEFQSFAWGNAVTPEQAPPGPATPPPSQSIPVPPEPVVGPPTPEPGPAVAADGSGPATTDDSIDSGFVTFGAPAAEPEAPEAEAPPVEAGDPLSAEPAAEAAAPAQPTEPATQPTEPSDQPEEEEGGFETYIAPAPLRPPTDDQEEPTVVPEPPAPAPEPIPEPAAAAPPPPPPPPPAPPAPVAPQDDLAATVMPSSVTPPPVEEKPKPVERKPEPEPAKPAKERKGGKGALIGFGIAAVIAAVLGFVIGGGSGGTEEEGGGAPTVAASNADVETKFPSDWKKISDVPQIPGMQFASPVAQAPGGAAGGESVVVGQVKEGANNSTLLPAGFLTALGLDPGEVPPRKAVRLVDNKLEAYRYANLRPNGLDQPVTLFTVPTSEGVATVACVDPSADCESIANTLKLNAGNAFPVGPSKEYAAGLGKTLGSLDKQVAAGRKELQGASTPKAQAAAAKDLSAAYKSASASVAKLEVSPADRSANQQLASALKETGNAYGKLASAASSGSKSAYSKATKQVQQGEQSVAGALRGLEAAGYKIAE